MTKKIGKEKNNTSIVIAIVALVIIMAIIVYFMGKNKPTNYEIKTITYSYSASFGLEKDTALKRVIINSDGMVILKNDFDSLVENYTISSNEYKELHDYVNERGSIFDQELNQNLAVSDGSYNYLSIILSNGDEKTVGGYMITNKKFDEIRDKIIEIVGQNKINNYRLNVGK